LIDSDPFPLPKRINQQKVKERWPEYTSRAALHGGDQPQYVFGELVGWYKKVWKEAVMYVYWRWIGDGCLLACLGV
jgi:hypothetical protein